MKITEHQAIVACAAYASGINLATSAAKLGVSERGLRGAIERFGLELRRGDDATVNTAIGRAVDLLESAAAGVAHTPEAASHLQAAAESARAAGKALIERFSAQLADVVRGVR